MGQEDGKKWAAAAHSQPTIPKSDSLLDVQRRNSAAARSDGNQRAWKVGFWRA
ncbi:hypothetical protein [Extensimonas vulgaris]|uniref:hypothetical protein n=1 Tax=Extensimonas vulgaris TaxID=1031594 RepID=UPI0013151E6E|nr:hypothetical protein [Extensimonas vulgaris]